MLLVPQLCQDVSHFTDTQKIPVIGFSATLGYRADGQALLKTFDRIVYQQDVQTLIEGGYLAPLKYTHVRTGIDFASLEVSSSTFDFDEDAARATTDTPFFNKTVVQTYLSQCSECRSNRSRVLL